VLWTWWGTRRGGGEVRGGQEGQRQKNVTCNAPVSGFPMQGSMSTARGDPFVLSSRLLSRPRSTLASFVPAETNDQQPCASRTSLAGIFRLGRPRISSTPPSRRRVYNLLSCLSLHPVHPVFPLCPQSPSPTLLYHHAPLFLLLSLTPRGALLPPMASAALLSSSPLRADNTWNVFDADSDTQSYERPGDGEISPSFDASFASSM
jgi:hypothetical protein